MAETSKSVKKIYNWVILMIVVGIVIVMNIIGSFLHTRYARIDMTEDSRYSLSAGTIKFLENKEHFKNRLLIKIYLAGELPAEVERFRKSIEDKLVEFKQYAGDRIEYQFIDPNQGTDADQDYLKQTLYNKGQGIMPMDIVYTRDGSQSNMLLWPGATIEYGGSTVQVVQFLPGTKQPNFYQLGPEFDNVVQNSINNLEYMLLSSIRKATQREKPTIAFLSGHGELTYAETQRVRALISPYYSVIDLTLNDSIAALDNVKGLIIARPRAPFSDKDKYIIDQFVMRGGRLMCFIDRLTFPEDTLTVKGMVHTTRMNLGGLERMLFDYGIKVNDNYVVDVRCAPKLVPMAKQNMIPWFFHIAATPSEHPIARNIDPVMLRYVSEIQFVGNEKRRVSPILTSSTNSNVTGMAPLVSLGMPMNYGKNPALAPNPESEANKRCVAGMVEGSFDSYYKNRIVESFAKNPESKYKDHSEREGKVLVVANGDFIRNYYDSMQAPNKAEGVMQYRPIQFNNLRYDEAMARAGMQPFVYGNQEFFQNLVDYMMGDNSVLDIRSKHIDLHPIDREKVKTDAGFYRILNVGLPSLIIILLAFLLFYLRKRRYARS